MRHGYNLAPVSGFFRRILICILPVITPVTVCLASSDYPDDEIDDDYTETYTGLPPVVIEQVDDFAALGRLANDTASIILLEMSASHCEYCRLLEEEVLKPMLRSNYYVNKVFIRQIKIDSRLNIRDFDGSRTTPADFASRYRIYVTPTLLILNEHGKEIAERIIGVQSLDFYAGYVDEALNQGLITKGKELHISP